MSQKSGARFTEKQGYYLAFIHTYVHMFGRPPAEADIQRHFRAFDLAGLKFVVRGQAVTAF